jgi:truncated hemoglobin YjbI
MNEKVTVIPMPANLKNMTQEQIREWLAPMHASLVAAELQRESASEALTESSSPETEPNLSSDSDS